MKLVSIRGATTVEGNDSDDILQATKELLIEIEKSNDFSREDVVSILFSSTRDLDQVYPAKAARDLGYRMAGLMCFNEMYVEESLEKCIRLMILCNSSGSQEDINHVYLRNAKVLRPDLSNKA